MASEPRGRDGLSVCCTAPLAMVIRVLACTAPRPDKNTVLPATKEPASVRPGDVKGRGHQDQALRKLVPGQPSVSNTEALPPRAFSIKEQTMNATDFALRELIRDAAYYERALYPAPSAEELTLEVLTDDPDECFIDAEIGEYDGECEALGLNSRWILERHQAGASPPDPSPLTQPALRGLFFWSPA